MVEPSGRRIALKLRKMTGGTRAGAPGLTVLSPPSLPFPTHPMAQRVNASLYGRSVRSALRGMGHRADPLLWIYTPTTARYLDRLPARGIVYHCVDRWWAFDEYDADEMRACHEILCRRADHVFVFFQLQKEQPPDPDAEVTHSLDGLLAVRLADGKPVVDGASLDYAAITEEGD